MALINLVDEQGARIGEIEKLEAHQKGVLHEAFSIFVFNSRGELLLQQRAEHKYHSGGLWTNTCCSHAGVGEAVGHAAHRRLQEEMGFDCELETVFAFTYKAEVSGGLIEHEYDHVLVGRSGPQGINPDPEEAGGYRWVSIPELQQEIETRPDTFTPWLKILMTHDDLMTKVVMSRQEG